MSTNFADIVEEVKALSIQEKQELHQLIEKYLIDARRDQIYEGYLDSQTELNQGELGFSSDTGELKGTLFKERYSMIEIAFSSSFKRAFKKRVAGNANAEARFWEKVEAFKNDPFDPKLRTHKLSGKLKDL